MKRTLRTFVEVLPSPCKMYKSEFSIPFPSQTEAEVAYNSLRVEVEPSRSELNRIKILEPTCSSLGPR